MILSAFSSIVIITLAIRCEGLLLPRGVFSSTRSIDLRSDTVTKPTSAMRKAMFDAELGDDVYGEDPTVHALEERVAKMFGKEKSLFFPSGTMANLAACLGWCTHRGSEMILGDKSHIHVYEQGGVSQFGGIATHLLANHADGTMDLDSVESAVRDENNIHFPRTALIAVENTHNLCGGRVLPAGYLEALGWLAREKGVPVHLDGARIWHAVAATQIPLSTIVQPSDSITACLSKGLGAPVGSMLVGPSEFIARARRARKALGGGMRQAGVLAAAGMKALDDFEIGVLEDDHDRTKKLVKGLEEIKGFKVNPDVVETNIIMVEVEMEDVSSAQMVDFLGERGVLTLPKGPKSLRLVVHRDITDDDVDDALLIFQEAATAFTSSNNKIADGEEAESTAEDHNTISAIKSTVVEEETKEEAIVDQDFSDVQVEVGIESNSIEEIVSKAPQVEPIDNSSLLSPPTEHVTANILNNETHAVNISDESVKATLEEFLEAPYVLTMIQKE